MQTSERGDLSTQGRTYRSIDKQPKAGHLQQTCRDHKVFPAQPKADDPNRKGTASIRQAPRRSTHMTGNAQTKVIKQADTYRNRHTAVHDGRCGDHLRPSAREVEEGRRGSDGGDREDGEEQEDGDGAEEALVAYREERGDAVACCGKREE